MFLLLICFVVCTNIIFLTQKQITAMRRNVIFLRVCGDYVILHVTFFIENQIGLQNISRTKILIARSGKS